MKNTEIGKFVPLNLRAFMEADPFETRVVLALNLWHWWKGEKEGPGLRALAAISRLSYPTAKRVTSRMLAKDPPWIKREKGFGQKNRYRLTVPDMTFKEAYTILERYVQNLLKDDPQLALWELIEGSHRADNGLPQSPLSKNKTLQSKTEGPKTSDPGFHPDEDFKPKNRYRRGKPDLPDPGPRRSERRNEVSTRTFTDEDWRWVNQAVCQGVARDAAIRTRLKMSTTEGGEATSN